MAPSTPNKQELNRPIPKGCVDFPAATTSFKIEQDKNVTKNPMNSIFKIDYPAHPPKSRIACAELPALAEVMHRDDRFFNERASETVHSFEYRYLPKPVLQDFHGKLRATNFKMDKDVDKLVNFDTTHKLYFTPKDIADPLKQHRTTTECHVPQGDKDKMQEQISDYRHKYKGHDTSVVKVERAPCMHEGGPPTVKGDERLVHFSTTHNDKFNGTWLPRVQPFPAPTGTNVPNGDTEKINTTETTTNFSYANSGDVSGFKPYSQEQVSYKLAHTNFKERDGHNVYNDYQSTAASCYTSKPAFSKVERYIPEKHRNHSDLPHGDLAPDRIIDRISTTTSRFYHGNPPLGLHNKIISGANLRTKSKVWFGEPPLEKNFYDTTTNDTFQPVTAPYTYNRSLFYKDSAIPLDYYSRNEVNNTTHSSHYLNPNQGKTILNPEKLENIKSSHIFPPLKSERFFHTTNKQFFTPKTSEKIAIDPGHLQKSSVPLGTFNLQNITIN